MHAWLSKPRRRTAQAAKIKQEATQKKKSASRCRNWKENPDLATDDPSGMTPIRARRSDLGEVKLREHPPLFEVEQSAQDRQPSPARQHARVGGTESPGTLSWMRAVSSSNASSDWTRSEKDAMRHSSSCACSLTPSIWL
eukprot:3114410-Pleurochrysis_carterae.AAC.1